MPFVEPFAPTGYLSDVVFRIDGFCERGETGQRLDARNVLACERDACLKPLEVNTNRERYLVPWPTEELKSCMDDLSFETRPRYDALNAAFEEPILVGRSEAMRAYRLYLFDTESFAHRMIRVVKLNAGAYLVVKGLEATEVSGQGRLSWRKVRAVSDKEWTLLESLVSSANYWALPPRLHADWSIFGGKFYELEGVRVTEQHLVMTPTADGKLGKVFDYLKKLADGVGSNN
jgi:hypothetical protein